MCARSDSSSRSASSARLRSVKSSTNATPSFPLSSKRRRADQHGNTAAVFPEVLLLERLRFPVIFSSAPHRSSRSRHSGGVSSVQRTRPDDEILAVVSHHAQKRVIGLNDPTFEIPDENPDDVGVDQAPDLRFAFCEIAVKPRILQRDRRLRRKQLQYRRPGGREDVRSQIVFKVENTDELCPG